MDVTSDRSCCKEQYSIGTWNVRSMNQGKLEVVKQETARVNINILEISELKWTAAAAAAKSLQSCPNLCDPIDGSHQAPPSLGFSRQEHWSGLPFPSPMQESEKWKWNRSVMSDSSWPHGLQPTRLLHPWDFPGKSTGVGCQCLLQNGLEWMNLTQMTIISTTAVRNPLEEME